MRYVAFLRAINVGGRTTRMEELRAVFEGLGFECVETFIASGNVIFESGSKATAVLQKKIEAKLLTACGYDVSTFIRTDAEVAAVAAYRPFRESELKAAAALNVAFIHEPLDASAAKVLSAFRTPIDDFHAHGREVYWLCRKKQSDSTFSNAAFEKGLAIRATFRGINTVRRLADKYPPR